MPGLFLCPARECQNLDLQDARIFLEDLNHVYP